MSVRGNLYSLISTQLTFSAIISDNSKFYTGTPSPLPLGDAPLAVMWLEEPQIEQFTMGAAGRMSEVYNFKIRLYLGAPDMTETDAVTAASGYADRMRYALSVPADLEATSMEGYLGVFDAGIIGGSHNLETFRATGDAPWLEYTMKITEHRARNAAAS